MFGSEILEIVIGLALVYLLLSLLTSILNELVMSTMDARGKNLKLAIEAMVDGKDNQTFWLFASLRALASRWRGRVARLFSGFGEGKNKKKESVDGAGGAYVFSKRVFNHPLFRTLREPGSTRYPSYLSEKIFSRIILDELMKDSPVRGEGKKEQFKAVVEKIKEMELDDRVETPAVGILKLMQEESQGSMEYLQSEIEKWYSEVMQRASGWYKRKTQLTIFVIGFLVSITFNADTLNIASYLKNDPEARAQVVEMASTYVEQAENMSGDGTEQSAQELMDSARALIDEEIQSVSSVLGLGWEGGFSQGMAEAFGAPFSLQVFGIKLFGWLMTTFALSLGAPFWFDVLNKAMNLRGAAKATKEQIETLKDAVG